MADRSLQRMIHVGCRQLGLDADLRRELQLVATGKASMAEMTDAELRKVVDALKARGFHATTGRRPAAPRADVRYCHVLWRLLCEAGVMKSPGAVGLNAFIRVTFATRWGHVPIDIDAMRDWEQIKDVVDTLKDRCRRVGIDVTSPGVR